MRGGMKPAQHEHAGASRNPEKVEAAPRSAAKMQACASLKLALPPTYPRKTIRDRLSQATTATTAHACPAHDSGEGSYSSNRKGEFVGSVHGNLFLYGQDLAPFHVVGVAGGSSSLSLRASV